MAFICLLTGSVLSALQVVIIQRTAVQNLNWDPKGYTLQLFLGIYRHRKIYKREWGGGRKADVYVWLKCKTGEFVHIDFSVQISWWEYKKWRGWKRSKEYCFPGMRYCQGVHILTPVLPIVATTNSSLKPCRIHCVSSYAEHLEEICENGEISDWNFFFHCDWDVHYIEQEAAEITFSEAAKSWLLTKYLS